MPPRYVLAGHKNLLFYLFIWFSFTISNRKTVQFDYDVPITSTVKNAPDFYSQFDSQSNNNDIGVDTQTRDFPNPTLNRGRQSEKKHARKPAKYKRSVISKTAPKHFAQTSISGQSTEKGNNKLSSNRNSSELQVNTTGYVKPSSRPNNQRNSSENAFNRINNTSATNDNGLTTNNKSIPQNSSVASLNDTVNGTKIEVSRANNTFNKEWNITSENKNNSSDKSSNATTRNSGVGTDNNRTFNTVETNNVTKDHASILTNKTVNGNENIDEKSKQTKNFTGIDNSTNIKEREVSNHTARNQTNVNSSKTETPILKTAGTEKSVNDAEKRKKNAPETEMIMENSKNQDLLTNVNTDTPLNGHLEKITPTQSPEYRSDKPRSTETESIQDMATKMSNNQQASNRLNPSQPGPETLETIRKPDLHLLTPEANVPNILTTSDKNKETQQTSFKPNKGDETLLKKLIQTTSSDGKKTPETPKPKMNKKRRSRAPADDTEYKPQVEALSNNEVEKKYKTKSNEQPKFVRRKVLEDFVNDLRGLCVELSNTTDRRAVALPDISLTTILTPFSGKSNTFFEICPLKNETFTEIKNSFAIGTELEEKYKSWACVENQAKCDGLCLGITHLISHYVLDIFTNRRLSRKQAYRSTVVQVVLINPKKWTKLETPRLSKPVEYKLQLYSTEVQKDFEIACCVWERNMWNKSACQTVSIENGMIHCACQSLGYTAAFLIESGTEIPLELETLSTDMKKKLSDLSKNKKKSLVNYKFEIDADYNQTVGNDKKATEEWFRGQIAKQLNLSKDSIERVIIAPECDDCDLANDSTGQNFTHKVRDLYPSAPGSIKVVVQVKVDSKSNVSAAEIHKHLQDKINNNELVITDKNNNKLEINNDQNVGVEIEAIDESDNSLKIAIILGVVTAVLIFFIILIGFAINKKLKKGQEKILPFNKKLTPYLNPTYKSFHNENTLDGTIESLVRIRRRSDQFLYEFDKACWDSGKGVGMGSHILKPSGQSLNSTGRRHSQPPSLTSTIYSNKSMVNRTVSPPMPGYVDDNSV